LLTSRERELLTAIAAGNRLVGHSAETPLRRGLPRRQKLEIDQTVSAERERESAGSKTNERARRKRLLRSLYTISIMSDRR
jgi:hypothetical protein